MSAINQSGAIGLKSAASNLNDTSKRLNGTEIIDRQDQSRSKKKQKTRVPAGPKKDNHLTSTFAKNRQREAQQREAAIEAGLDSEEAFMLQDEMQF